MGPLNLVLQVKSSFITLLVTQKHILPVGVSKKQISQSCILNRQTKQVHVYLARVSQKSVGTA